MNNQTNQEQRDNDDKSKNHKKRNTKLGSSTKLKSKPIQKKRKGTLIPSMKYKDKAKQNTRLELINSVSDKTVDSIEPKKLKWKKARSASDPEQRKPSILVAESDLKTVNNYIDNVLISHEGARAKRGKKKLHTRTPTIPEDKDIDKNMKNAIKSINRNKPKIKFKKEWSITSADYDKFFKSQRIPGLDIELDRRDRDDIPGCCSKFSIVGCCATMKKFIQDNKKIFIGYLIY